MNNKVFMSIFITLIVSSLAFAQRPQGPPGAGGPPPNGGMRPGGNMQQGPRQPQDDWLKRLDANKDGKLDSAEFKSAIDASFSEYDQNSNGVIEANEMRRPPRNGGNGNGPIAQGGDRPDGPPAGQIGRGRPLGPPPGQPGMQQGPPMGQGMRPDGPQMSLENKKVLPPFFFLDRSTEGASTSKADFERIVRGVFTELDKNGDGLITREEARTPKRQGGDSEGFAPPPPNGQFIAAELRFGDKLTKSQPFSAETVIEDTRRLYDGTTVTKQSRGAFYRDGAGRTRREQPLEMVGGFNIAGGDGKPQMLVFINDFDANTQYFLDINNKVARTHSLGHNPPPETHSPPDAKTESLGTKMIEGVQAEGTRVTFEIPAGQIGNGQPIQVVSESWFSTELQMVVLSRHLDPLAGEHLFKLVNIKRSEPSADLFSVPPGFRIEKGPRRAPDKE
ncbi:MAG: hypothetical protein ACKVQJ_12025 [Pyrinomonadaceae bacterium]